MLAEYIGELEQRIEELEEALGFYADPDNYEADVISQWEPVVPVSKDNGYKARQALRGELE